MSSINCLTRGRFTIFDIEPEDEDDFGSKKSILVENLSKFSKKPKIKHQIIENFNNNSVDFQCFVFNEAEKDYLPFELSINDKKESKGCFNSNDTNSTYHLTDVEYSISEHDEDIDNDNELSNDFEIKIIDEQENENEGSSFFFDTFCSTNTFFEFIAEAANSGINERGLHCHLCK